MISTEHKRLECEARYWIARAHQQTQGQAQSWRCWLREKLAKIEEIRKHPQPELREAINREVAKEQVQSGTDTQVAGNDGKPAIGDSETFLEKLREAGF